MVKVVHFTLCIFYCIRERKIPFSFTLLISLAGPWKFKQYKTDEQDKYSILTCAARTHMERFSIVYRLLSHLDSFAKRFMFNKIHRKNF